MVSAQTGFADGQCEDDVRPGQERLQLGEAVVAGPLRARVARQSATSSSLGEVQ